MKVIYHHFKDPKRESIDIKDNWWTCPPELFCTKQEEDRLLKIWHFFYGKNTPVSCDSLGHKQCLYLAFKEIPLVVLWIAFKRFFFEEEHWFDLEEK